MAKKLSAKRKKELLVKMEYIIGNSCYNGNIQNWGPGGRFEGEGRDFRYPVTFYDEEGNKDKKRRVDGSMPIEKLRTGCYAFGANELHIFEALEKVLDMLQKELG